MFVNTSDDMYWQVGANVYYNKFLAIDDAYLSGNTLEFYFYDKTMEQFMWQTDPTTLFSWEELLRMRAEGLRQTHKHLRLWFTGGRDSYLALKAFVKNNIVLDELVFINFNYRLSEYLAIFNWIKNNHHLFPTVKKITQIDYDLKVQKYYIGEKWEDYSSTDYRLPIPPIAPFVEYYYPNDNSANITGCDKSRLFFDKANIYSYMIDMTVITTIGVPNHEPFFISKNVPIYQHQTWSLVNYVRTHLKHVPDEQLNRELFQTPDNPYDFDSLYYKALDGMNRTEFAEISLGMPLAKSHFSGDSMVGKHRELVDNWQKYYPELYRSYRNGIFAVDDIYGQWMQKSSHKTAPVFSKKFFITTR